MSTYRRTADLPQMIPVFPLDGALLLPGGDLPLQIFEPRYLNMIDDVMAEWDGATVAAGTGLVTR